MNEKADLCDAIFASIQLFARSMFQPKNGAVNANMAAPATVLPNEEGVQNGSMRHARAEHESGHGTQEVVHRGCTMARREELSIREIDAKELITITQVQYAGIGATGGTLILVTEPVGAPCNVDASGTTLKLM